MKSQRRKAAKGTLSRLMGYVGRRPLPLAGVFLCALVGNTALQLAPRRVGAVPRVGAAFLDDGDGRFPVVEPSEEVWFSGTATDWLGFSLWSEEDAVPVSQLLSGEEEGVFPQAVDRKQRAPLKTMQRIRTANLARWYMLDKSFPIFCFVHG